MAAKTQDAAVRLAMKRAGVHLIRVTGKPVELWAETSRNRGWTITMTLAGLHCYDYVCCRYVSGPLADSKFKRPKSYWKETKGRFYVKS